MKRYAILVGGGSGSRMKQDIPKQFLLVAGKPVLMHTMETFYQAEPRPELILVLNVDFHEYWEKLCSTHEFTIPHSLVKAGHERFFSVKNGLKLVKGKALVAIHDAVRPNIKKEKIEEAFSYAEMHGNAVLAIQSKDSVRISDTKENKALARELVYLIQTPQIFTSNVLRKAYQQEFRTSFTDDASVVEHAGVAIHLVEGDPKNIKITYPEDLVLAEVFLKKV
ncbi:MAG: 2-C-methyl-D-erythritol 4-phosphate cytidylyltransferase [Sphingobacteriaceae bacterium]|nr:2-C-methyl-D-erythritol 4-phosphate cytidylyltransferase [Sphingobacteriaceae bacterium]